MSIFRGREFQTEGAADENKTSQQTVCTNCTCYLAAGIQNWQGSLFTDDVLSELAGQPVYRRCTVRIGRAACLQTMYCQNWQGSLFTDDVLSELAGQPVYRRCTVRTSRAGCLQTMYCQNWQGRLFTDDVLSELAGQPVYRRFTVRLIALASCLQTMYCQINGPCILFTANILPGR